jgi:hypothetical protein
MPVVPLTIPPGVVKPSTDALARGRYWDANLVRWRGQHMLPVGGWTRLTSPPLASTPRLIKSWRDLSDIRRNLYLCDTKVIVQEGSTFTDHTPADFVGDDPSFTTAGFGIGPFSQGTFGTPRTVGNSRLYYRAATWSADTFGEDMLFVASSDGRLFVLSPGAVTASGHMNDPRTPRAAPRALPPQAVPVSDAPTNNRSMLVTEERHVMLFGADGNPRRVAWSSRENYNDWDFANTTNTAGFFDLDVPGWIIHATKVRGGVLIFTDSEVWLCRYRGLPFIYGFERIGTACGILSPLSYAVTAGVALWMGQEGFWMFDGGTVRPVPCDLGDFLYDNMNPTAAPARVHASPNGSFPEVWWFYPSKGQTECDRLVIFSVDTGNNWWSMGALSRSAMAPAGVYPYPLAGGADRNIYQHEDGWLNAGLTRVGVVYAETAALSIPTTGERRVHVVQAQMDTHYDSARVDVTAFARETHNGPEETFGPYQPRDDGWTDLRFSGRDIRLRFTQQSDGDWTLGEARFDVRQGSKR